MVQDLRYGMRMLLQNKSWTAVAVLSLALGIGVNTALFSVVDAQLLSALPVENPAELVRFMWVSGPNDMAVGITGYGYAPKDKATGLFTHKAFSYPTFERLRASNQILSDIFAFAPVDKLNVLVNGQAEIATGQLVSGNYFTALGVQAALGRTITTDDDKPAAPPVALISHGYWQRRFGLDPSVVGKTVNVNKVPFTIIGVAPREFSGTIGSSSSLPSVSIPLAMEPQLFGTTSRLSEGVTWWLLMMGRSKPGVSVEQIRANLEGIFQQSAQEAWNSYLTLFRPNPSPDQPGIRKDFVQHQELMRQRQLREIQEPRDKPRLRVESGSQGVIDFNPDELRALAIRMTVVGLVLLIVCANVANLLLARAATRQKEIAMRLAVGATRLRLIRQLLTESALLALLGGTLGMFLAVWSKDLLLSWFQIPFTLDWRVLGFTAAVSLFTAILFGLAPALRATNLDLMPAVKNNRQDLSGSRSFLTKSLLVAQVAMSLVLLIGAGLFIGTLRNLHSIDPGFNPENILLFKADARLIGYEGDDPWVNTRSVSLYEQIIERLEALPGVRSATLSMYALLSGNSARSDGTLSPRLGEAVYFQAVRANFFDTMEMPIALGRSLSVQDNGSAPKVAVVNQTLARKFYPNVNPLGQRIGGRIGGVGDIEIVGIVRDAKYETLRQDIPPTVYLPYLQFKFGEVNFEVRTAGDPGALFPAIREAVRQVEPDLPLTDVKTQIEQVSQTLAQERLLVFSSSLFGGLGMLLACVGLYGILSFSVARRTHEIGIRMALGAQRSQVVRMVMTEALWMIVGGIGVGLAAALAATRLIANMLYGLAPNDALTIVLAISMMIAVAMLAGYLPAMKAARVDPMVALRDE